MDADYFLPQSPALAPTRNNDKCSSEETDTNIIFDIKCTKFEQRQSAFSYVSMTVDTSHCNGFQEHFQITMNLARFIYTTAELPVSLYTEVIATTCTDMNA